MMLRDDRGHIGPVVRQVDLSCEGWGLGNYLSKSRAIERVAFKINE